MKLNLAACGVDLSDRHRYFIEKMFQHVQMARGLTGIERTVDMSMCHCLSSNIRGSTTNPDEGAPKNSPIRVRVSFMGQSIAEMLDTIAHEMVHCGQIAQGFLHKEGDSICFHDMRISEWHGDDRDLPFEKEAYAGQKELYRTFVSSLSEEDAKELLQLKRLGQSE